MRRALLVAALAVALPSAAAAGVFVPGAKRASPALAGIDPITGTLVNLWGSWCHPCREESGQLRRFLARHPGTVLGIDVEDSKAGARSFQRRYRVHFPTLFDPHDVLALRLKAPGTPTTFFLDRRHRIVAALYGAGTLASFERGWKLATR
jgi:thiol-disulfide isomerase/thioredoxin